MIPTAILLGLIGGTIPRYRWWAVPIVGIIWSIILETSGDPGMTFTDVWLVGLVFGALNAAVGVAVTWALASAINTLRGSRTETSES